MLLLSFQHTIAIIIISILSQYFAIKWLIQSFKRSREAEQEGHIKEILELIEREDKVEQKLMFKMLGVDIKYDAKTYKTQAFLYGSFCLVFASLGLYYLATIVISAYNYFKDSNEVLRVVISFSIPFLKNLPIAFICFFGASAFFVLLMKSTRSYHYAKQRNYENKT